MMCRVTSTPGLGRSRPAAIAGPVKNREVREGVVGLAPFFGPHPEHLTARQGQRVGLVALDHRKILTGDVQGWINSVPRCIF